MKFSTREDIAAPIAHVFARLTDFERVERAALRRGAEVARTDQRQTPGPGMAWKVGFAWRGKRRRAAVVLSEYVAPSRLLYEATGKAFEGTLALSLIELSPRRTRVVTELEFRPRTFAARLIVQSLRLTRARLNRRFRDQVAGIARQIEADQATTGGETAPSAAAAMRRA